MAEFVFTVAYQDGTKRNFRYDNASSSLTENSRNVPIPHIDFPADARIGLDRLGQVRSATEKRKNQINRLRIKLGLGCNSKCRYCIQSDLFKDIHAHPSDVEPFMALLEGVEDKGGLLIGLWGGEPLVYWKTLNPLGEKLREKFPRARIYMPTNASLIDEEKADWVDRLGITLAISHDGPGQHIRGDDPFDDPRKAKILRDLYARKTSKVIFSSVIHRLNKSRKALYRHLSRLVDDENITIECADLVEPSNAAGIELSMRGGELYEFRQLSFNELIENQFSILPRFFRVLKSVRDFIGSLHARRTLEELGTRNSVLDPHMLCVDIKGNILTYNNVALDSVDRTGRSHVVGHLSEIGKAHVNPLLGKPRARCLNCPVLQMCKGGDELTSFDGPLFEQGCDNFYTDNVVRLAVAMHFITGGFLVHIDGEELPKERKDIFGLEEPARKAA
jgi:uncharacterized protein